MLAQYKSNPSETLICETTALLERLLKAAEPGGRMGNAIEILVLQALAHHAGGDFSAALIPLERALVLAEPEGYVRLFLDEGANMAQLLHRAVARETMRPYASKLLVAFSMEQTKNKEEPSPHPFVATQSLPEPLTERELEILRLFKTELSGPEIADKLIIALSTLRTHTKSIYSKLGVNSRRAAVNRAEDLHLI